jgi:hypothetical protein
MLPREWWQKTTADTLSFNFPGEERALQGSGGTDEE